MAFSAPPFSMSSLIEEVFPELDVFGRRLMQHATIEVYAAPNHRGIRAVIAYNENDHHSTQRFSIGHELGHWLLDFRRGERARPALSCGGRHPAERRADYFAAELLAPLWLLDGHVTFAIEIDSSDEDAVAQRDQKIQRIASKFNLSMRCARNRVLSLGHWRKIRR